MDWNSAFEIFCSVAFVEMVFKGIDRIRYKRDNKKLKKNEVDNAEVETDKKQIDLGDMFLEKVAKWSGIFEKNINLMMSRIDESDTKRDRMWKDLSSAIDIIQVDVSEIKHRQDLEEEFLNGDWVDFLRKKGETVKQRTNGKKKTVPMPRRKNGARSVRDVRDSKDDNGQVVGFTSKADTIVLPPL